MKINKTFIEGLLIVEPQLFKDDRGFFYESYNKNDLDKVVNVVFVQDNESKSNKGVIRGLHFQKPPYAQTKLIRCVSGKILDVAVDLRKSSPTFGKYFTVVLSEKNHKQLYIPEGFAHGFSVLSDQAIVHYKCSKYYDKASERGIRWDDPLIRIDWQVSRPILSTKDRNLPLFSSLKAEDIFI